MIKAPDSVKRYQSAKSRFFKPVIMNFLARECPRFFGPTLREKLTDEIIHIFEAIAPERSRMKPGQVLWNALDQSTRGDSPGRRYVPVVLTLICEEDIEQLTQDMAMKEVAQNSVARMIREAYEQGGILSSRDLGLLTLRHGSSVSSIRKHYEEKHQCTLPHPGVLHDMGSSISHKALVVKKAILEKKDPAQVARECNHTQGAVDRYLKDYHRVKTLYDLDQDIEFIHLATQISKHVIKQYINLIKKERKSC
ncbi:MAG: DUF1670 domain-containing protein [Planctomycetota bacterium]|nr:DUF1670 domain-containing protein [Planctomycetota bacterium]